MLKQDHTTVSIRLADKIQNLMTQLTGNIIDKYRNKNGNWLLEKLSADWQLNYKANTYDKEDFESCFRNDSQSSIYKKKDDDAGNAWDKVAWTSFKVLHRLSDVSQLGLSPTFLRHALLHSSKSMWWWNNHHFNTYTYTHTHHVLQCVPTPTAHASFLLIYWCPMRSSDIKLHRLSTAA